VCAAAESVPYRVSIFAQGAMCVSCNALSLHIGCSMSVRNFLVPEDTVPRLESVFLLSEGDVGAGEEGITGFWKGVRLNIFPSLP